MTALILSIYVLALSLILLYSFGQLDLLLAYRKSRKASGESTTETSETFEPLVTVQLPIYNELYVVERLLKAVSELDYPKEKLEIQVLDDSTDESVELTAHLVAELRQTGLDILHIRRSERKGFKAGALRYGLEMAKGEYLAIFDADFIPPPHFLKHTLPHFRENNLGLVQTRWGHTNRDYSIITKTQAFALDAHFTIEQAGRNTARYFINFNGTAGVWRKACILDAGNWQSDTLTEDLDLSYRSQLKGWKFKYLEGVETPAELPILMSAARSQQFRWNKGGAENFRKVMGRLIQAPHLNWRVKLHGALHLLNSSMFLNVFIVALLSIPILFIKFNRPDLEWFFNLSAVFVLSTLIFFIYYWHAYRHTNGGGLKNFFQYVPKFVSFFTITMGLSLHNSIAVLEGHLGKRSSFVRTPKFNVEQMGDNWKSNKYIRQRIQPIYWVEAALALYFFFGVFSAFWLMDFGLLPFHLMLAIGFSFVFLKSIRCKL